MRIAVDFDGTIVEHKYPEIGETKLFAFETLRELQKQGHLLILWTFRYGKQLEEAVEFCKKNGVEFYAVNKSYPEEVFVEGECSRKIDVDLFIDDRNLNGFVEWSDVWRIINENAPMEFGEQNPFSVKNTESKSFIKKLFGNK